jgi:hypothetical protein
MTAVRFRAVIEPTETGSYVVVPDDVRDALRATGRTSVTGTIDGHAIRGQVMPYTLPGRGSRVLLGITKATRAAIGKKIGDTVAVELVRDDRSRSADVVVPPELAAALDAAPGAREAFERLAPSHRREHAEHVAAAKGAGTRERRAARVVEALDPGTAG